MGGFLSAIGDSLSRGLEHTGDVKHDFLDTMQHEIRPNGPTGAVDAGLNKMLQDYTKFRNDNIQQLSKPVDELWNGIKKDPALAKAHDYGTAPLKNIHAQLRATQHPLQAQSTQLMSMGHGGDTLKQIYQGIAGKANVAAQAQVFGPDKEFLVPLFYDLYKNPDPTVHSHADALLNIFSSVLHDRRTMQGDVSETKFQVRKYINKLNKLMPDEPLMRGPKDIKPVYEAPSGAERSVHGWLRTLSAPFMAIPHIGTAFNLASTPISMIAKGVFSLKDQQFRQLIEGTGVLASTMHSIMDSDISYRTGATSKLIGSPAASLLQSMLHNPGFHTVRLKQLMLGGAVGYHATIEWAQMAAQGNKRAIREMQEMGLNVKDIIKQGGKLNNDQLKQGIFHYVNNRLFIDKSLERPLMSNANKWMRTATMFHAFVSYQSHFMGREIMKMMKTGDYISLAQYAGTIGILFPVIAPMMKSAEMLLRTGSPSEAMQSMQTDYDTLEKGVTGQQVDKNFLYTYVDMLSYLGAYGVYTHMLQAAEGHRLASALAGPLLGIAGTTGQDLVSGAVGSKTGDHNFKPLGRDALRYGIPVAGGALAHQLLPNEPAPRRRVRRYY
jgi:hypothetical protein